MVYDFDAEWKFNIAVLSMTSMKMGQELIIPTWFPEMVTALQKMCFRLK